MIVYGKDIASRTPFSTLTQICSSLYENGTEDKITNKHESTLKNESTSDLAKHLDSNVSCEATKRRHLLKSCYKMSCLRCLNCSARDPATKFIFQDQNERESIKSLINGCNDFDKMRSNFKGK